MTVQSSFLIRCSVNASGDLTSGKAYYIHHVQSGAEFRACVLDEAARWMADQNIRYLADALAAAADTKEDLR